MSKNYSKIEIDNAMKFNSGIIPNDFVSYLKQYSKLLIPLINQYLSNARLMFESRINKDVDKYLFDPLNEYCLNTGKLHRPLTCLASYKACTNNSSIIDVFPLACSIEFFQNAALIHDDIADGATLRRSKPCMHKVFDIPLALNAGDFGLSMVIGCFMDSQNKNKVFNENICLEIINELIKMQYMTIEGQAMDLGWAHESRFDISEDDYFVMATKKTAYYSAAVPLVLGAICAESAENVIESFRQAGTNLGLAFQLQDDLLNVCDSPSNSAKEQKDFLSDISEGKKTLIVVKALEYAKKADKATLIEILNSKESDKKILYTAAEILHNSGAVNYVENKAQNLAVVAKDILKSVKGLTGWKDLLIDMCDWAIHRRF